MGLRKKALYFTMDALLASIIIIGGFILVSRMTATQNDVTHINFLAQDLLVALDHIQVEEINNSFIQQEIANGNIKSGNSVLEQIASYWALNETAKATTLTQIILNQTLPSSIGLNLSMDTDQLFSESVASKTNIVSAHRMVSGIDKDKPLDGSSSFGYLRSINNKKTSAYAYFGGFVGQGNITVQLEPVPADVNASRIRKIVLEGDFKRDFSININNNFCANLNASIGNFSADFWDLSTCNQSINSGANNFSITFDSLNDAYIGGGYIRVDYETDTFFAPKNYTQTTYNFPQINGIVNLFDAFEVPGELYEMEIFLHYFANHSNTTDTPFYLNIGNATVYNDLNSTTPMSITLSNTYLSSLLNYSLFENTTVPIRLGFENLTYKTEYIGNADVVLITDVSGSMDWNFTHDNSWGATKRNCDDSLINDLSTQRLSVAKCLDKDFVASILNISGNYVGLVSYDSSTDSTLGLTTNLTTLETEIGMGVGSPQGYVAGGSTCICCGINSAASILSSGISITTLIDSQDSWNYSNNYFKGQIPQDSSNRSWFDPNYNLAVNWSTANAVLGHDAVGGGVTIDSDLGSNLTGTSNVVDLWELAADTGSIEVDFSSGLNSTANTYGIGMANDGWDWSSGVFDYSSGFTSYGVVGQRLRMVTPSSGSYDTSGAFAVTVVITADQYNMLQTNGTATLSFNYWWDDYRNYFEGSDQVWLKGRWISPTSGSHLLGSHLDTGHSHSDSSEEIATSDNPDVDIVNGFFSQDISNWIEGPGTYYLELGGKLDRSASNEWGYFYYDNILLLVSNNTDHYYFRNHFDIADISQVQRGFFNLLADDIVSLYLNGNPIYTDQNKRNGTYWDVSGYSIPGQYFKSGENVLAAVLKNSAGDASFDFQLFGVNDSQQKSMFVMTDGDANVECSQQGWTPDLDGDGYSDTGSDDAIQAACDAASNYGISIYSVGFAQGANENTLEGIATCGNGLYRKSENTSELQIFYQDVVLSILEVSRQSQSIIISSGTPDNSEIYLDSYIWLNHSSEVIPPSQNEIELVFQSSQFDSCNTTISIPSGLRVSDAHVTSYSGEHWTSLVSIDNYTVFNLSSYATNFSGLGDPYIIQIPPSRLTSGSHDLSIFTADNPLNYSGCSNNNTLIYTAFVNSSTTRSQVVSGAIGCHWVVEFEDGINQSFTIPTSYNGSNSCYYTNSTISYSTSDAYDVAVFDLLNSLDFDDDGRVLVNLAAEDLEIVVTLVSEIPFLWGPAIMEVELWQ